MDSVQAVISKIVVMFIIMAVGFICGKTKLITEDGNKQLSRLSLWVVNPILIFMSFQNEYSSKMAGNLAIVFGLAVLSFAVMILLSMVLVPKKNNKNWAIDRLSIVLTNCGFVGIPLVESAFGKNSKEGVMYITMFLAVFIVVSWTWGAIQMSGKADIKVIVKNLLSPAIISVVLGLVFYFCRIDIPGVIAEPLNYVGSMNTPLAMIVAGATLANTNILACFKKPRIYYITALRQFVFPAVCCLMMVPFHLLGVEAMPLTVVAIGVACPTAVMTTMFAHIYEGDSLWASEVFALSTLVSIVSVPAVMWFMSILGIS